MNKSTISRSTDMSKNDKIPPIEHRPKCIHENCHKPCVIYKTSVSGDPYYRKVCSYHHSAAIAKKHGVQSAGHLSAERLNLSISEYRNRWHPSRKYRKNICENQDGRLGFKCTSTILWHGMLDVDHINGDPSDNSPTNLQTLCKCCHAYKTMAYRDGQTPGRKLKVNKNSS
jgi:hypothetical protein